MVAVGDPSGKKDVLRARQALCAEYEALKRDLVREHDDVQAYSEGKSAFVERLLAVARDSTDLEFEFAVPAGPDY